MATIIFPIFGALILFSLIVLAIRILKADNFHGVSSKNGRETTNGSSRIDGNVAIAQAVNVSLMNEHTKCASEYSCQTSFASDDVRIRSAKDQANGVKTSTPLRDDTLTGRYVQIAHSEYQLVPQYSYEPLIDVNSLIGEKSTTHRNQEELSVSKLSAAIFKALNHSDGFDQPTPNRSPRDIKNGEI